MISRDAILTHFIARENLILLGEGVEGTQDLHLYLRNKSRQGASMMRWNGEELMMSAQAAQAVADAKESAKPDYAAANRLLQERTGGDPAHAAEAMINQEFGL